MSLVYKCDICREEMRYPTYPISTLESNELRGERIQFCNKCHQNILKYIGTLRDHA